MSINKYLLKQAQLSVKQAFMPPEAAGGAPPMDPSMMGGAAGGVPPMDPSMMGGAPPMDPAMMGAAPAGAPPVDPAMAGGAPPVDPAAGAPADPTEQIRAVVQEEIQKAMAGAKGAGKPSKKNDGQNTEMFMRRIQKLLTHLYSSLGLNLPHDILDDVPSEGGDQSNKDQAQAPQDGSGLKLASHDNIAEKAAGILYLLRKK